MLPGKREEKKKKEVFSQGILRKNNKHVAVDVFIYVFVNEAPRKLATGESASGSQKTMC